MKMILLKIKDHHSTLPGTLVIYDDLVTGLLLPGFYVISLFGTVFHIDAIIQHYKFPLKDGERPRIVAFLSGHSPAAVVEYYQEDPIEIESNETADHQ